MAGRDPRFGTVAMYMPTYYYTNYSCQDIVTYYMSIQCKPIVR